MSTKETPQSTETNIALCYVRLSYTREDDDSNSPERQRANIQQTCNEKGWQPEWYEDTGGHRSGRSVDNRPQWRALEKRLVDSEVVALVANDLSRLHRKGWRIGALLEHLEKHNVALVTASSSGIQIDTSTTQGRIFVQLAALFDEYYAEDVSAKARDSIRHRKRQGKVVGRTPFGTQRDSEGYLIPSDDGAWLMPDGTFRVGERDKPPHLDAVWRGYFDAARHAMELYAAGKLGIARIAYQLDDEGWCYRTVRGEPRAFERDDVRRIVANWREYGGLVSEKRARNRPAYEAEDPDSVVFDAERAVMSVALLRKVARVRQQRTLQPRRTKTHNVKMPYPLAVVARCDACSNVDARNLPSRTSTLQGYTTSSGARRYRHSPGMKCTTQKRSVLESVLNTEFERILDHLIIKPEYLDLMQQIALQDFKAMNSQPEEEELERQKAEAIARCRHRLERARFLFVEGDLSEDEYVRIRSENEQEIAHWEARTVKQQEVLIELMTVLGTLTNLLKLCSFDGE